MTHRILIADDDEFLTSMYRLSLKGADRDIAVVHDGEEVLAEIKKQKPDILVLDLLMPKLDGFGVLAALQKDGYDFPIIILSNLQEDMDQKKCMELGAKDFYCKNRTDLDGLVEKIIKYMK